MKMEMDIFTQFFWIHYIYNYILVQSLYTEPFCSIKTTLQTLITTYNNYRLYHMRMGGLLESGGGGRGGGLISNLETLCAKLKQLTTEVSSNFQMERKHYSVFECEFFLRTKQLGLMEWISVIIG